MAAVNGHTEVVKLLVAGGADLKPRFMGRSALQVAAAKGHTEVVKILREAGAGASRQRRSDSDEIAGNWPG